MPDLRTHVFEDGYTLQQNMLLRALKMQAEHGMLMTNPRVTGYTSFAKASPEIHFYTIRPFQRPRYRSNDSRELLWAGHSL